MAFESYARPFSTRKYLFASPYPCSAKNSSRPRALNSSIALATASREVSSPMLTPRLSRVLTQNGRCQRTRDVGMRGSVFVAVAEVPRMAGFASLGHRSKELCLDGVGHWTVKTPQDHPKPRSVRTTTIA